jgi:hypothetical protein
VPEQEVPASKIDQSYLKTLVEKIASSVLLAHKEMQEVKIGAVKGQVPEIVYNRRPRDSNGLVKMAFTLEAEVRATRKVEVDGEGLTRVTFTFPEGQTQLRFGPIDPEVCVLRMDGTDGQIVGSLVNFGCHPVCIYPHLSTAISADYPVCATRVVEQAEGGLCLFALGLAGNAVPFHRGILPRQQIGRALGGEALKRLQFVTTTGNVALKALKKEIALPTKKRPPSDETADQDSTPEPVATEIQVLRLGDVYILGLPGEILVEVGLEIKAKAGLENLFIVTICNDAIGYVCHSTAYEEGGYEPGSATNLAKGAAELMVEQALDLLKRAK